MTMDIVENATCLFSFPCSRYYTNNLELTVFFELDQNVSKPIFNIVIIYHDKPSVPVLGSYVVGG